MLNNVIPSAGLQGEGAGGQRGFGAARGIWGWCQGEGAEVGPGWGWLCHQRGALGWSELVGSFQGPAPPESQTGEDQTAGAGPSPQQPQAHPSVFSPESSQRVILHENSGAELHPSPSLHFPIGNRSAQGPQINPGKSRHAGNKQGPSYLSTVPKRRQDFPWQIIQKHLAGQWKPLFPIQKLLRREISRQPCSLFASPVSAPMGTSSPSLPARPSGSPRRCTRENCSAEAERLEQALQSIYF